MDEAHNPNELGDEAHNRMQEEFRVLFDNVAEALILNTKARP